MLSRPDGSRSLVFSTAPAVVPFIAVSVFIPKLKKPADQKRPTPGTRKCLAWVDAFLISGLNFLVFLHAWTMAISRPAGQSSVKGLSVSR
jgi:hypothetical protein